MTQTNYIETRKNDMSDKRLIMKQVKKIFGILMVFVYGGVGLSLIVTKSNNLLTPLIRILLGVLLILYSLFRGYKTFKNPE